MYSLDPQKNGEIAGVIQSIVVEEMLHMALVCNIINALGGSPVLNDPGVITPYPGPIPGGIDDGQLIVGLAPLSKELLEKTFMEIEEPENPLAFEVVAGALEPPPPTIGVFYSRIKEKIVALGDGAFPNPPRNQVTGDDFGWEDLIAVTNVATASAAINTIVQQGEGTTTSPMDAQGEIAHYYRFAEVFHGRKLIPNPDAGPTTPPDKQFIYGGDKIELDTTGVYAVPTNPKTTDYPVGSAARRACTTFNYDYTGLLIALHDVFNGRPEDLGETVGKMFSLRGQAMDMMSGTPPVGPSFEWQPVNP
jgi:hypothetical protein